MEKTRKIDIGLILILLGIFLNIFGEQCPNFILRAKRDAALSLARRVFEFFNGKGRKIELDLILGIVFKIFAKNRQIRVRRGLTWCDKSNVPPTLSCAR